MEYERYFKLVEYERNFKLVQYERCFKLVLLLSTSLGIVAHLLPPGKTTKENGLAHNDCEHCRVRDMKAIKKTIYK